MPVKTATLHTPLTDQVTVAVTRCICVRQEPGSNLSSVNGYYEFDISLFPRYANDGIVR
jgi:hypothetical protein